MWDEKKHLFARDQMHKKEPKTCPKCGELYFGDHCVGCKSNQYAHYSPDLSTKNKILIVLAFLVIVAVVLITYY